jgi:hypothetical protein
MTNDSFSNRPRIIKSIPLLQAKIGSGEIDDQKIEKMQKIMDETAVDFAPMAAELLKVLATAIEKAKARAGNDQALITLMTDPVMQIKANGAMFGYALVGNLANIVLHFLENIDSIDDTVIEIVEAHYKTLTMIVNNKLSGSGGDHGAQLEKELRDACSRYFARRGTEISFVNPTEEFVKPSDE